MGVTSTQGFLFRLVANGTQLDLFHDEDYLISNNATGLFDIGVLPSDFTRQITLPGSKINNAFFEHCYDISITSPFLFSTNTKVPAYFDFGGLYASNGYLQLNKVNVIANKFIDSYEVTIYGGLSSFARDINKYYLTDLSSLQQYNHTSSIQNITSSWAGNLFNGDIVYPLAEYGQQISYSPEENNFGIDSEYGGLCVQDFKPSIRIKPVLNAIFAEAGYTYTSSFMNQAFIDDVYMVCNNALKYPEYAAVEPETYGLFKIGPLSGSNMTNVTMSAGIDLQLPWFNVQTNPGATFNTTTNALDSTYGTELRGNINLNINISGSGTIVPQFYLKFYNTNTSTVQSSLPLGVINDYLLEVQKYNGTLGTRPQTIEVSQQFASGYLPSGSYQFKITYLNSSGTGTGARTVLDPNNTVKSYFEVTKATSIGDNLIMDIPSNMPFATQGIKQIDFILGLQKKFNLVIYPNKTRPNEFIIETFNDWYKRGEVKDFNRYINLDDNIEVISANNLAVNKLNFGDTLDGDYVSQQFAKQANREYGKSYYTDTVNFFSQGTFDVKTTFASSQLLRIAGTGQSGSVGGINPIVVAYPVNGDGEAQLSTGGNPYSICSSFNPIRIVYSTTGLINAGATLYYDAYGTTPVNGYNYITDRAAPGCAIWTLNLNVVDTNTGTTCAADGGGCI
jgi:hypothetical protein